MYNYRKLSGRIVERFGTRAAFAKAMQITPESMSLKLSCVRPFKQTEIEKAITLLGIERHEVWAYFFDLENPINWNDKS